MRKYLVILFMVITMPVWAATYYVTQAGSGSGDGSTYSNSESVANHNADTFAADDIIYLCGAITSSVVPPSSGTSGHPIIYQGHPSYPCTITCTTDNGFKADGRAYLTLDGVTVTGSPAALVSFWNADSTVDTYSTIQNCTLHDNTTTSGGIDYRGKGATIYNCTIYNIYDDGIYLQGQDATISYCNIYAVDQMSSGGDCIQLSTITAGFWVHHNTLNHMSSNNKQCFIARNDGTNTVSKTNIFEYNICTHTGLVTAIPVYIRDQANKTVIRNNQISGGYTQVLQLYYCNAVDVYNNYISTGDRLIQFEQQSAGVWNIWNNTLVGGTTHGIRLVNGTSTIVNNIISTCGTGISDSGDASPSYNDIYNCTTDYSGCSDGGGGIDADPLLTGYTIPTGSPCKDTGTTLATVYNDIRGCIRPFNAIYDIGCFEYGALGPFTGTTTGGLH